MASSAYSRSPTLWELRPFRCRLALSLTGGKPTVLGCLSGGGCAPTAAIRRAANNEGHEIIQRNPRVENGAPDQRPRRYVGKPWGPYGFSMTMAPCTVFDTDPEDLTIAPEIL